MVLRSGSFDRACTIATVPRHVYDARSSAYSLTSRAAAMVEALAASSLAVATEAANCEASPKRRWASLHCCSAVRRARKAVLFAEVASKAAVFSRL